MFSVLWECNKGQKNTLLEFTKKHGFKLIEKIDTSLTLGCFNLVVRNKKGRVDLTDEFGNILDENLTVRQANKKINSYEKAAKKEGIPVREYLDKKVFRQKVNKLYNSSKFIQPNKLKYRIYEVESAVDLEKYINGKVRASKFGEAGDFIIEGGEFGGKSVDVMGLYDDAETLQRWGRNYELSFEKFKTSIDKHFRKVDFPNENNPSTAPLDFVAIDFRYFDAINPRMRQDVIDYISQPNYQYREYVENNLIKLNF